MKNTQWATYTCPIGFHALGIWPEGADGTDINSMTRLKPIFCFLEAQRKPLLWFIGQTRRLQLRLLMTLAKFACSSTRPFIQKHPRTRIAVTRPMLPGLLLLLTIDFFSRQGVTMPPFYNGPSRRNSKTRIYLLCLLYRLKTGLWLICYNYDLVTTMFNISPFLSYFSWNWALFLLYT